MNQARSAASTSSTGAWSAECGRLGVVVDEHRERDLLVAYERRRVSLIAGADRDDLGSSRPDLVVPLTQLRGVLPAEQSAEMSEEDERDQLRRPVVTEAPLDTGRVLELDSCERSQVHTRKVAPGARRWDT